jgi:Zn-dependent protease
VTGTIRLFRFSGIDVFLHWSWFIVAVIQIRQMDRYSSSWWSILEYVALFAIVTLHEFGHALACRQVGGRALRIILWPIGGAAYVDPPPRPGATLWSIAAGPLVNVALIPVLGLPWLFTAIGPSGTGDFTTFLGWLNFINLGLLIFNVLPIYPLDGGQILRALLWYFIGRARSLMAAVIMGSVGVAGLALIAILSAQPLFGILVAFAGIQCYRGYKEAQLLRRIEQIPRRQNFICPSCKAHPFVGPHWTCEPCRVRFDIFETSSSCPVCRSVFPTTQCGDCGTRSPFAEWIPAAQAARSPY